MGRRSPGPWPRNCFSTGHIHSPKCWGHKLQLSVSSLDACRHYHHSGDSSTSERVPNPKTLGVMSAIGNTLLQPGLHRGSGQPGLYSETLSFKKTKKKKKSTINSWACVCTADRRRLHQQEAQVRSPNPTSNLRDGAGRTCSLGLRVYGASPAEGEGASLCSMKGMAEGTQCYPLAST